MSRLAYVVRFFKTVCLYHHHHAALLVLFHPAVHHRESQWDTE